MAVVDASALIALLADEPARPQVEAILTTSEAKLSTVNLAEVYDRIMRLHGQTREAVGDQIDRLRRRGTLTLVPVDEHIAARAGELRATHYHRTRRAVSHADCIALASAELSDDSLATTDASLAAMARDEGTEVIALPDSQGRRP